MALCPIAYWASTSRKDYDRIRGVVSSVLSGAGFGHRMEDIGRSRGGYRVQAFDVPYEAIDEIRRRLDD